MQAGKALSIFRRIGLFGIVSSKLPSLAPIIRIAFILLTRENLGSFTRNVLCEFVSADKTCADHERRNTTIYPILGRARWGKAARMSLHDGSSCAAGYSRPCHVDFHPANMRAQRDSVTLGIHLRVVEVVVALRVVSQLDGSSFFLSGVSTRGAPLRQRPINFPACSSWSSGPWPARLARAKNRGRHRRAAAAADTPCNWRFEIEFPVSHLSWRTVLIWDSQECPFPASMGGPEPGVGPTPVPSISSVVSRSREPKCSCIYRDGIASKSSDDSTSTPGVRANSVVRRRMSFALFQRHRDKVITAIA